MDALSFEAIGTHWEISSPEPIDAGARAELERAVHARIDSFDRDYSRFRDDSLVARMSRDAGTYTLPADGQPLLDLYRDLYRHTGGGFTPLIGQVLVDAGYDAQYSLKVGTPVRPPSWDEALEYAFPQLTLKQPALLDFGGAGKGYLVDIVAGLLAAHGLRSYTVDAGGDMLYASAAGAPLRVGLEDPRDTARALGVATITGGSICGSAGNRRTWGPYHHLIDPRTLASPRDVLATWVVADTALLADGLAGCLFFVPASALQPHYHFQHLALRADGSVEHSPDFPVELFTSVA